MVRCFAVNLTCMVSWTVPLGAGSWSRGLCVHMPILPFTLREKSHIFLLHQKRSVICDTKIFQKRICAGRSSTLDLQGELTTLPQTPWSAGKVDVTPPHTPPLEPRAFAAVVEPKTILKLYHDRCIAHCFCHIRLAHQQMFDLKCSNAVFVAPARHTQLVHGDGDDWERSLPAAVVPRSTDVYISTRRASTTHSTRITRLVAAERQRDTYHCSCRTTDHQLHQQQRQRRGRAV